MDSELDRDEPAPIRPWTPLSVADGAHATAAATSDGVKSAGGPTQRAARVIIRSN